MRARVRPLLAELHAHTTWSDGSLTLPELVDLHGRQGFDVLCVTDHVVRTDDPWRTVHRGRPEGVRGRDDHAAYLAGIARETARAEELYGLLVVPGLELTYNDLDPRRAAHAVAIGLHDFVSVDRGIAEAIATAREAGAALVAAHPYDVEPAPSASRRTEAFARDPELAALVHRFELFNRDQLFSWVAAAGHAAVASGDVHEPGHVRGWKTLLPCARTEESVVEYLRGPRPAYLVHLERVSPALAA